MRSRIRALAAPLLALPLLLAGCAHQAPPALLLLGEVHDNTLHHQQRFALLQSLLDAGQRPALLMEHFDSHHQAALDAARAGGGNADALIAVAGGKHWPWQELKPFVELALRHELPLIAVNIAREPARELMRDGLLAKGFAEPVDAALIPAQAAIIAKAHCGKLPESLAPKMALAQLARDQQMARELQAQAGRGAVLLAGNGHLRRDLGVPRWLRPELAQRVRVIAWVESPAPPGLYDEQRLTPPAPRKDPCA
jgi:uncharacterized iron-regulated protein